MATPEEEEAPGLASLLPEEPELEVALPVGGWVVSDGFPVPVGEAVLASAAAEADKLLLLLFPMLVTPLLNTLVTFSMTLPRMMLPMLARAMGCLAAAHTGLVRLWTLILLPSLFLLVLVSEVVSACFFC